MQSTHTVMNGWDVFVSQVAWTDISDVVHDEGLKCPRCRGALDNGTTHANQSREITHWTYECCGLVLNVAND